MHCVSDRLGLCLQLYRDVADEQRVGVSRSASIVVSCHCITYFYARSRQIAYLMQYHRMGLMDAYLLTRARRLNVLIQPNLRFFHELFGWEVELARKEADDARAAREAQAQALARAGGGHVAADMNMADGQDLGVPEPRRIMYSWPAFCRDLVRWLQPREPPAQGSGITLIVALSEPPILVQLARRSMRPRGTEAAGQTAAQLRTDQVKSVMTDMAWRELDRRQMYHSSVCAVEGCFLYTPVVRSDRERMLISYHSMRNDGRLGPRCTMYSVTSREFSQRMRLGSGTRSAARDVQCDAMRCDVVWSHVRRRFRMHVGMQRPGKMPI